MHCLLCQLGPFQSEVSSPCLLLVNVELASDWLMSGLLCVEVTGAHADGLVNCITGDREHGVVVSGGRDGQVMMWDRSVKYRALIGQ